MIHDFEINGLRVQTGDLICTTDGDAGDIRGQFWRLLGKLIPGEIDHIAVYVGPGGRCVEAAAKAKVNVFETSGRTWNARAMLAGRGPIIDVFHGVAYPLRGRGLSRMEILEKREAVAHYCLRQAALEKPYNLNFLDSSTERAFYCSQLAYRAYLRVGVDLNTGMDVPELPLSESIIFPQEIWSGCIHCRAGTRRRRRAPGAAG